MDGGVLPALGSTTTVPLTWVHTSDLAACLAAEAEAAEHIDIGWDHPVSMREVAGLVGSQTGKKIKVWAVLRYGFCSPLGLVPVRRPTSKISGEPAPRRPR
jgi:uncharacterized protein YbjT (DUF2867 family)